MQNFPIFTYPENNPSLHSFHSAHKYKNILFKSYFKFHISHPLNQNNETSYHKGFHLQHQNHLPMQIHIVEKFLNHFHLIPYQLYTKYIKIDFRSINISNFPIIDLSKIYGIYHLSGSVINICEKYSLNIQVPLIQKCKNYFIQQENNYKNLNIIYFILTHYTYS